MPRVLRTRDGSFEIKVSLHTIEPDEWPELIGDIVLILSGVASIIEGVYAKDPITIGLGAIQVAEGVLDIKKILET